MDNQHELSPCALCPDRMAVPGMPVCTVCDVTMPALVPDSLEEVL
jgi:hypothetical protein